jgi:hypothetical protein
MTPMAHFELEAEVGKAPVLEEVPIKGDVFTHLETDKKIGEIISVVTLTAEQGNDAVIAKDGQKGLKTIDADENGNVNLHRPPHKQRMYPERTVKISLMQPVG